MNIKVYQLPFLIVLTAMPIQWVIAFTGVGAITWVPEGFALLAFAFLLSNDTFKPHLSAGKLLIGLGFIAHLVVQVTSGAGAGGTAIISVILMSIAFVHFLNTQPPRELHKLLIAQISVIYAIHVAFIVFEVILLVTGNADVLAALAKGQYRPALRGLTTPQSLANQAQSAAQFSAFAILWFSLLYFSRSKLQAGLGIRHAGIVGAAIIGFVSYPSTTITVVGGILFLCIVFLVPLHRSWLLRLTVTILFLVTYEPIIDYVTYKANLEAYEGAQDYYWGFLVPLETFLELPRHLQLWGVGDIESIGKVGIVGADFGLLMYMLRIGVLPVAVAIGALLVHIAWMFYLSYHRRFTDHLNFPWVWIGIANALLCAGNVLSLSHYTVSLGAGARALFSFHIAILMLSIERLMRYRRAATAAVVA